MKQKKFFEALRIVLFCAVLIGGCVLGFCLSLRPAHSDSENRDLTDFPTFTWDDFLDGTYTSSIGLWYSDTFPFREELLALNTRLRGLYGIKTQTASGSQGDDFDTDETFSWNRPPAEPDTAPGSRPQETDSTTPPDVVPGHEVIKGYLVDGIHGYELYYFNRQNSDRYARFVVQTALDVGDRAQIYAIVTPMSYAWGVSDEVQAELGASNLRDSIGWIYSAIAAYGEQAGVKNPIITVDAYSALEAHRDEYIFFRTDHHWTALGAHYASRAFLDAAGRDYPALDAYQKHEFTGFTGSLAGHTKAENPALENNPDTIYAYESPTVNDGAITITQTDGTSFVADIINKDADATFSKSQRYRCFVDGDYPYSVVHNPAVGDGSAILLIKESYGNAFIPMLVDSYEYVYAIDYRFFRSMSISDLVDTYHIDTVLFLNNPVATSADYNMNCLDKVINIPSKH